MIHRKFRNSITIAAMTATTKAIAPLSNTAEERTMGSRRINAKKKIKRRAHSANRKAHEKAGGDKATEVARIAGRPARPMAGR
jgi:ABC-type uncharacterized transport system auxiliary subunit